MSQNMQTPDLVFVDTETTGLDPFATEVIEIAVVRVRQEWAGGQKPVFTVVDEWSSKIKPTHIETANPASLRINGYTPDMWVDALQAEEVFKTFAEKTAGAIMVAHNVAFDAEFIGRNFHKYKIENKMHYHRLDTVSMAYAQLQNIPEMPRYSLGELCKYFGITNERQHSALSDARACFEIFKKLIELS